MAVTVCNNVTMKRRQQPFTRVHIMIATGLVGLGIVGGVGVYMVTHLPSRSAVVAAPKITQSEHGSEVARQSKTSDQTGATDATQQQTATASTDETQKSATPTVAQSPTDPVPAPSIVLTRVSQWGYLFTTTNFSSASYLKVIEPITTNHPQTTTINSYGVTVGPAYSAYPRQQGGVTIELPVGVETGDTYRLYVCADAGGSCGLRSNALTGTVTSDSFGMYIDFK